MENQIVNDKRGQLLQIISSALEAVHGRALVHHQLNELTLPTTKIQVVAIGKAAASMMQGALDSLGTRLDQGLVITKYGHALPLPASVQVLEAGHPVVDSNSLQAGKILLEFVQACDESETLLFLISGGTSALVEVLPDSVSVDQLAAVNNWLLSQPLTIQQINVVRKAISLIKGGKLVRYLKTQQCWQLTLSDVVGNDLSVIGSGLLVKNESALPVDFALPNWISDLMSAHATCQHAQGEQYEGITHVILADNQTACHAARRRAQQLGLPVHVQTPMQGEALQFTRNVINTIQQGGVGLYIWGGETVVRLPPQSGAGGRCQHIALAAAIELEGIMNVILVAVATDGTDGPGDVAGAMIDGQTIARGRDAGLDANQCLAKADSGSFLAASGDLIDTGPTGTNVNDLVLVLKW